MPQPDLSRRIAVAFLGTLPLAGLAAASPATPDPLLDLIRACRAGNDAYNALLHPDEAAIALTYGPPYAALSHAPAATTRAGAMEAPGLGQSRSDRAGFRWRASMERCPWRGLPVRRLHRPLAHRG